MIADNDIRDDLNSDLNGELNGRVNDLGPYDFKIVIDIVDTQHRGTCAQCDRFAVISHVVRVFQDAGDFHEYDLCLRCASGDVDPTWLAVIVRHQDSRRGNDRSRIKQIDRSW